MTTNFTKKRLVSVVILSVASGLLATGTAQAQFTRRPSKAIQQKVQSPSDAVRFRVPVESKTAALGGLGIKTLEARRSGNRIMISATVGNTSFQPLSFSYKISKRTGSTWTRIQEGGSRMIASKENMLFSASIPHTNDPVRFKFEINGGDNDYKVKEVKLAARHVNYVVRYGTSGDWVLAREYHNDLSNGFDASELARTQLHPLGLETQIRKKKKTGLDSPFSINTRIYTALSVRTSGWLERAFDDRNEAEQFRRTLISLVRDRRLTVESVREQEI